MGVASITAIVAPEAIVDEGSIAFFAAPLNGFCWVGGSGSSMGPRGSPEAIVDEESIAFFAAPRCALEQGGTLRICTPKR